MIAADPRLLCRRCREKPANRPRQMCYQCYLVPGEKEKFPTHSKFAQRGHPDFYGTGKPCEPTDALPGTPEKVAVLEERCRRGERLWHPLDAVRPTTGGAGVEIGEEDYSFEEV